MTGPLIIALLALAAADPPAPIRVQLTTGGHDYAPTIYAAFEGDPGIRTIVNPHPKAFRPSLLRNVDVLVLYDSVDDVPGDQREVLRQFVESGNKGLVVLHHAIVDFPEWEWWWKEVVGGKYLLKPMNGKLSSYRHDVRVPVAKTPAGASHPVTEGLPPRFEILDETYKDMWISPRAQVLLTTTEASSDGPVAWISPYARARVIYLQFGHDRHAHQDPNFQRLLRNAIRWAAGR